VDGALSRLGTASQLVGRNGILDAELLLDRGQTGRDHCQLLKSGVGVEKVGQPKIFSAVKLPVGFSSFGF
jgi:hypothetical protein